MYIAKCSYNIYMSFFCLKRRQEKQNLDTDQYFIFYDPILWGERRQSMSEMITFSGVETNNLKNISVKLKKNAINLLIGPSGSGKSSLIRDVFAKQYEARKAQEKANTIFKNDQILITK